MSERETDRTAPWMLNHCANLKHGTVQSGVLVSACDWCAKYADPLCAMARPGGPDDHDWPAGCSCARRHNVAAPVVSRAAGGETLADLYGSVPDLIPNPMTSEAWVRRYRDGFDAGYARALSSAPAPEERPNPPSAREVSAMRDLAWRTLNEHDPEVDYEKVAEGLAGYVLHLLAASPSGAGSPVAWALVTQNGALSGHQIAWEPSAEKLARLRESSEYYNTHFPGRGWTPTSVIPLYRAAPPAAGREPSEDQRDAARVLIETFAGRTDDAFVCDLVDGPFKRPDGQMLNVGDIRAALGASAQTNTGEGR